MAWGLCFVVGWDFHTSCAVEYGSCIVCGFISVCTSKRNPAKRLCSSPTKPLTSQALKIGAQHFMPLHSPISQATLWLGLLRLSVSDNFSYQPNRFRDWAMSHFFASRAWAPIMCHSKLLKRPAAAASKSCDEQRIWLRMHAKKILNTCQNTVKTCKDMQKERSYSLHQTTIFYNDFRNFHFHWHIQRLPEVHSAWSMRIRFCLAEFGLEDINSMDSRFPNQSNQSNIQKHWNMSNSVNFCNIEIPTIPQSSICQKVSVNHEQTIWLLAGLSAGAAYWCV